MRMRWLILVGLVAAVLWATALLARADGFYWNEGLGPSATVSNEMSESFVSDQAVHVQLRIGKRIGRWAFEGSLGMTGLAGAGEFRSSSYDATLYGADARYIIPVGDSFDAYLRGGLGGVSISTSGEGAGDPNHGADYGGRGIEYGIGAQLHGQIPLLGLLYPPVLLFPWIWHNTYKMKMGLYLEHMHSFVRLQRAGSRSLDGDLAFTTFGFTLGSDF